MGATNFYICDNGSSDGTWDILHDLKKNRPSVTMTCKRLYPKEWNNQDTINAMLGMAQRDGVAWMFAADADEFLYTLHGYDLQRIFDAYESPAYGYIRYYDNLPNGTRKISTHKKLFGHFPKGFKPDVSIGNHLALNTKGATEIEHNLWYEHYPVRSYKQYKKKLLNISRAFQGTDFPRAPHAKLYEEQGEQYMLNLYRLGMENNEWA
jgi:hypothetical protein